MSTIATAGETKGLAEHLEQRIRARIDSLSYLPTTAAVAMKFVELGKNLDADPSDYAKVINADTSLSSKILALANSSWAGVRNKVTNTKTAVNLLGLGTVRTLAISYCMTGLHNELRLSAEESDKFWESSVCKAVAAQKYAALFDAKLADEAFVAGMFQDFAIPVMYSTAKEQLLGILDNPSFSIHRQRQEERKLFRLDHTEVGRILAQKLELPDLFVDIVAFHHDADRLTELTDKPRIADAAYVAALFPHLLNAWHREDTEALRTFVEKRAPSLDPTSFLDDVQQEYARVYGFFHEGSVPQTELKELLESATREVADNTTELVGTVNELLRRVATTGGDPTPPGQQQSEAADKSTCDALTGVLNGAAFSSGATDLLAKAARYGIGFAVAYLDIDKFRAVDDAYGREFGDAALTAIADLLRDAIPQKHLIGRVGGDQFAVLFSDCVESEVTQLVSGIITTIAASPIRSGGHAASISLSAGLLYIRPSNQEQKLDLIMQAANKLMRGAKDAGGNRLERRTVQPQ